VAEPAAATIRYFAAARAAAGTTQEQITLSGETTVALLLTAAIELHSPELARVLPRCSYLLDGVAVRNTDTPIGAGQVLDILPPFAGG
jgi:molybdopterin synthase sulfur carrier subunit